MWTRLIEQVHAHVDAPLLINTPADLDLQRSGILQASDFIPARTEAIWRIPLASIYSRPIHSSSHRSYRSIACDLNRVVELDNTIRADIPGTRMWRGTLADFSSRWTIRTSTRPCTWWLYMSRPAPTTG